MPTALAVIGGVIAVAGTLFGIGWAIFKYQSEKKDAEAKRRETVNASLSVGLDRHGPHFAVTIRNTGHIPVYIREVSLVRHIDQPVVPAPPPGIRMIALTDSIILNPFGTPAQPLPVNDSAEYRMPFGVPLPIIQRITRLADEEAWVAINSNHGEIFRIPGDKVKRNLEQFISMGQNPNWPQRF
jgi:hypothetical protein